MAVSVTDDHLGTLTVESRPALETTIEALSFGAARAAMAELSAGRSPVVVNHYGEHWVISGMSYTAAHWCPDRPADDRGDQ